MESHNLQEWTRIGSHEPLQRERAPQQRAADVSSAEPSFFCRQDAGSTLRFMESFNLQHWTRIGAMNPFLRRKPKRQRPGAVQDLAEGRKHVALACVLECGSPLPLSDEGFMESKWKERKLSNLAHRSHDSCGTGGQLMGNSFLTQRGSSPDRQSPFRFVHMPSVDFLRYWAWPSQKLAVKPLLWRLET